MSLSPTTLALEARPELPQLDPYVVEMDDELAEVVDAVVVREPRSRERHGDICEHVELLRGCVEPDVWPLVEEIRGRIREREEALRLGLVRWAFDQGRRYPLPAGEVAP